MSESYGRWLRRYTLVGQWNNKRFVPIYSGIVLLLLPRSSCNEFPSHQEADDSNAVSQTRLDTGELFSLSQQVQHLTERVAQSHKERKEQ